MKKTAIGHIDCPVCGFDADVKEDKNGHAYIHCTDCNAQTFTRNDHRNGLLRKRMRPVTVTVTEQPEPVRAAQPVTAPTVPPVPAKPVPPQKTPAAAPAPPHTAPAAKKSASWCQPLIGSQ